MLGALVFLTVAPILGSAFRAIRQDIMVRIDPRDQSCFFDTVKKDQKMFIHFEVSHGGDFNIDVTLSAPSGSIVFSERQLSDSKILFVGEEEGEHMICYRNLDSHDIRSVLFTIVVGDPLEEAHFIEQPGPLHVMKNITYIDPLDATLLRLNEVAMEILNEQTFLRAREAEHWELAEAANKRVLWRFVIMSSLLLAMAYGQARYFRWSLEQKVRV